MDNLPDAPPLTPISSMLAGIHLDEFDDPQFSDDGSSLLSSAPSTLVTPSFAAESSASDTTATTGSTIFKRKKIKRQSFVFNDANEMDEINRPVHPGSLRTGTDDLPPSVLGQDENGAVFLIVDGDGRQRRPGTDLCRPLAVIYGHPWTSMDLAQSI
ncbi:hypothetical protein BDD12DRAFT_880246 [Trichophaea hybrida]|nr:hypothetical protein BDD12DRAFT_880246 [Trichophaea hybrida]